MFEMLKGAKVLSIHGLKDDSIMVTIVTDKMSLQFFHWQECCEAVYVAQVDAFMALSQSQFNSSG